MTGSDASGELPQDPAAQFQAAFKKIVTILKASGLEFGSVAEMTSYHVALQKDFQLFQTVRSDYVSRPYPAWTAVEVAGLRRKGALVEIRVVAEVDNTS